jgi:Carboxypeptidase regulatory-like domain
VPALAEVTVITGTVVDSSDTPQVNVTVNVQDPSTSLTVASTTTDTQGDFSVSVAAGTYNIEFTPPSGAGLQSYLATGVSTGGPPLTVVLKSITVVHIQGALEDSEGNVYTSAQNAQVTFSSPLNPGTTLFPDSSGHYAADLFSDQNFTVNTFTQTPATETFFTLPAGTLDHDQTYNVVLPVSTLTVSVRDASGSPVTGGNIQFQASSISPLPGIPHSSGQIFSLGGGGLDASGNQSITVPNGITLSGLAIHLNTGLILPFTLPALNSDQHVFLIFSETTGTVTVDQPPVVTGAPDRPANAAGWYNAPDGTTPIPPFTTLARTHCPASRAAPEM